MHGMDIEKLLVEITKLQTYNKQLGQHKLHSDYVVLLRFVALGLVYIFIRTYGYVRFIRSHPNGHDLLLLIYIGFLVSNNCRSHSS